MAFTELYCDNTSGANINAGDLTANGVVTSTNGAWSTVTNIFTATSGTPFSGVSVGDFASLYADGGTKSVYVARVTAVGGGGLTLTLSTSSKSGTAPTTAATGISCTTGGAWKGPNAAVNFPFDFVSGVMTNVAGNNVRVNFKNTSTWNVTAAITASTTANTSAWFQGYTTTPGDGGKAIIDGGTSGASYALFTLSAGTAFHIADFIFQNNGATGSASGFVLTGARTAVWRCVVNNVRGIGFDCQTGGAAFYECEAYACNLSNTAALGAFVATAQCAFNWCIAHDSTAGVNCHGFNLITIGSLCYFCIADTNGGNGFADTTGQRTHTIVGCDSYNNTGDGFNLTGSEVGIYNSNAIKNGGYGFNFSSGMGGMLLNCGVGSGTQANTSGATNNGQGMIITGGITYASGVTPWVDPANGDFRVSLAAAKGAGRGAFTETAASYAGTVGYPDVGAAQHLDTGGGSGGGGGDLGLIVQARQLIGY